jgi:hypothetical protein
MMRDSRPGPARFAWLFFFSAIASFNAAPALAASAIPVSGQVVVQPITVCAANCTGCAPVNDLGQTSSPSYIGFKDQTTGALVTDEILAQDLGLRITYLPLQQYCSPSTNSSNSNPGWTTTTFQTLHLISDGQNPPNYSSPDFMTLAQQPYIANNFKVPNPTTPGPSTACPVTSGGNLGGSCVPLSTTVTTAALFFVQNLKAVNFSGTPFGYGMFNGVNVAVNAGSSIPGGSSTTNTIVGGIFNPPSPFLKQASVIAHEFTHNFGLPHVTSTVPNLPLPLGCASNPACDLMAPGGTRTEWSPLSTFYSNFLTGKVDQLNTAQQNTVLDPDPLINPVQHVTTTIVADPNRGANFFDYTTTLPGDSTSTALLTRLIFIFESPKGFNPSSFTVISAPPGVTVTGSNFNGSLGSGVLCGSSSVKCWDVEISPGLSPPPSGSPPTTLSYALALSSSIKNPQLSILEGSKFTYFFSDQFVTTSDALPNDALTVLTADSVFTPDLTTPVFLAVPSSFVGSGLPCRQDPNTGACPTAGIGD